MKKINIAIIGVGNCASSLIQGIHYYRDKTGDDAVGLMHWEIGGYRPGDIEVVAAFDIDERKVGQHFGKLRDEFVSHGRSSFRAAGRLRLTTGNRHFQEFAGTSSLWLW